MISGPDDLQNGGNASIHSMSWLRRTFISSLGRKYLMAATGLLLVGFLAVHLAGNLLIYSGKSGEAFDGYAAKLDGNPLLPVAEIGLALLFVAHIGLALRVNMENREARARGYAVRASLGKRTLSSASMVITGLAVLVFLLVHLYDFRIGKILQEPGSSLWLLVRRRLSTPLGAGVYLLGVLALGLHLRHAFRSAFQSLGVNHPHLNPLLERASWVVAILFGLGFASFPVYFLLAGVPS
jgi:succinate dehydrogenase / fumarate reductase cytochrome b subunit